MQLVTSSFVSIINFTVSLCKVIPCIYTNGMHFFTAAQFISHCHNVYNGTKLAIDTFSIWASLYSLDTCRTEHKTKIPTLGSVDVHLCGGRDARAHDNYKNWTMHNDWCVVIFDAQAFLIFDDIWCASISFMHLSLETFTSPPPHWENMGH